MKELLIFLQLDLEDVHSGHQDLGEQLRRDVGQRMLFLVSGVLLILVLGGEGWEIRCIGGFQILQILALGIYRDFE